MNIEDDYLWDRSGEPDPEIQQLEEILGTLRHQPGSLEIPAGIKTGQNRSFFREFRPKLAIAAMIAIAVLGLALWFGLHQVPQPPHQPVVIFEGPSTPKDGGNTNAVLSPNDRPDGSLAAGATPPNQQASAATHRHRVSAPHNSSLRESQEEASKQKEGEAAKDQLMLALRMASAKLNFAQKKTLNTNPRDLIHNQHKLG